MGLFGGLSGDPCPCQPPHSCGGAAWDRFRRQASHLCVCPTAVGCVRTLKHLYSAVSRAAVKCRSCSGVVYISDFKLRTCCHHGFTVLNVKYNKISMDLNTDSASLTDFVLLRRWWRRWWDFATELVEKFIHDTPGISIETKICDQLFFPPPAG